MGTPQVYPTVWNDQGQKPGQPASGVVWDPKAPKPLPLVSDPQKYDIVEDQANPGKTPIETAIDKIQQHNDVAANTLIQKNRKRKRSTMELPFDPTIEEGTNYMLQGFAPNFDGKYQVTEVEWSFTGKGGSQMILELIKCPPPPVKTPGTASAQATGAITVPARASVPSTLLHDGGINSITPQPANVANLTLSGNETAPTWLNANGALNSSQQDLSANKAGPTG